MKNFLKKSIWVLALLVVSSPHFAHAADFGQSILKSTSLPSATPTAFISNIINTVTGILGVILIGMLVYGGALYLTSAGNEQRVESAKKTITYAIVGVVVIAAARIIAEFVINAVT